LSMAGSSLGAMVLVPFAAYLVDRTSWRFTWVALGAIVLILALPLAFFLRDDPTDVGLLPDGDAASSADSHTASLAQPVRGPLEAEHWSKSFRSLPIWQFSGAYWACGFITAIEIIRICGGGLRIRCYPREDLTHKRLSSGGKTGCYASRTSS